MAASSPHSWKNAVVDKLLQRNQREHKSFGDIVSSYNKLIDSSEIYKMKNGELEMQLLQLKQEVVELQSKVASGISDIGSSGGIGTTEKMAYEQKIYKLQEELTTLHRTKGEHASKIIELTSEIKAKEELMSNKEAQLLDAINNTDAMSVESKRLQATLVEIEATNQMLKDELQALHMAYTSIEEKLRKCQEENRELVERWLKEKAKDADRVNLENEQSAKARQEKLSKELSDAANEPFGFFTRLRGSRTSNGGSFSIEELDGAHLNTPPPAFVCITSVPDRVRWDGEAHDGEVLSVRFSISGKYFVTGGADRKAKIWEVGRGCCTEFATLYGCNASVTCVRFDAQEKMVLAASNDSACRIWTVSDQRLRHTLTGHTGKVMSAKFLCSDSSKIVSGSHDRTLKIWDLRSKVCTRTIFAGSSCNDLVTSDFAGTTVISGHFDKKIRFWDVRSDTDTNEIQLQGKITSLDLASDMNYLLASSRDDSLKLIDLRRNQVVSTYRAEGFKVAFDYTRACFSPDSQYLICGSHDCAIYCWNSKTNKLDHILREHKYPVVACAWHPNGSSIVTADRNKHAVLWTDV